MTFWKPFADPAETTPTTPVGPGESILMGLAPVLILLFLLMIIFEGEKHGKGTVPLLALLLLLIAFGGGRLGG